MFRVNLVLATLYMLAMPVMAVCEPLVYFWLIAGTFGAITQIWDLEDKDKTWGCPINLLERKLPSVIEVPELPVSAPTFGIQIDELGH